MFVATLAFAVSACSSSQSSTETGGDDRKDGGLIAITCYASQRAIVDPIRVDDEGAVPHLHDFFGASTVADNTDADQLQRTENNCLSPGDKSSYWVPTMFVEDKPIDPVDLAVYVTSSTANNSEVVPPSGLELISYRSAWMCARHGFIAPQLMHCPDNAVTRLVLEFPHCWDGVSLQFSAITPHVVSTTDECPPSHPVALPRFLMEVRYDLSHVEDLTKVSFSSGDQRSVHGDMLLAWDQQMLQRDIESCLHRNVTCGQTWSTEIGA